MPRTRLFWNVMCASWSVQLQRSDGVAAVTNTDVFLHCCSSTSRHSSIDLVWMFHFHRTASHNTLHYNVLKPDSLHTVFTCERRQCKRHATSACDHCTDKTTNTYCGLMKQQSYRMGCCSRSRCAAACHTRSTIDERSGNATDDRINATEAQLLENDNLVASCAFSLLQASKRAVVPARL